MLGSAFTQDGEQCRKPVTIGVALGAIGRLRIELAEAGKQVWDDREKIVPGHVDVHGDQQAAHRGGLSSFNSRWGLYPGAGARSEHRLDTPS
jgi:hypothetical protein